MISLPARKLSLLPTSSFHILYEFTLPGAYPPYLRDGNSPANQIGFVVLFIHIHYKIARLFKNQFVGFYKLLTGVDSLYFQLRFAIYKNKRFETFKS